MVGLERLTGSFHFWLQTHNYPHASYSLVIFNKELVSIDTQSILRCVATVKSYVTYQLLNHTHKTFSVFQQEVPLPSKLILEVVHQTHLKLPAAKNGMNQLISPNLPSTLIL